MSALMSAMKLAAFPIAALVLFLAAFTLIVFRVYAKRSDPEMERAGRIPIEDGVVTPRMSESVGGCKGCGCGCAERRAC